MSKETSRILNEGRFPIILSERKVHLESLEKAIGRISSSTELRPFAFVGGMGKKAQEAALEGIATARANGLKPYILATGAFAGEGFDLPALDTLILAMPVSFKGKLVQYSGRLHRPNPGKLEVRILDYVDANNPLTVSMFKKRMKTYKSMGYKVEVPDDLHINKISLFEISEHPL